MTNATWPTCVTSGARDAADTLPKSDARLAEALIQGQKEAALAAWHRFNPLVLRILRRMLGQGADLQDMSQDVFLRFFRKVPQLSQLESLRGFVAAIAVRRAQEEIKRRRVRRLLDPMLGEAVLRPSTTAMDPEARQAISHLLDLLSRLEPQDRTIYVLRHIAGWQLPRISSATGLSLSSLNRRFRRVTKRMTRRMSADPVLCHYLSGDPSAEESAVDAGATSPWPARPSS